MRMIKYSILLCLLFNDCLLFNNIILSAQANRLTLNDCIKMSQANSADVQSALNRYKIRELDYDAFISSYYPQLSLFGSIPGLNRTIDQITLDDGTESFISQSRLYSNASLSVSQRIGLTGGTVSISSGLSRIDILETDNFFWRATPFQITLNQPIFRHNTFNWDKKIEDLRDKSSENQLIEDMERSSFRITNMFFELYLAQISIENAQKNVYVNDTLYSISQGRYQVGKIAENDLLQSELGLVNAQSELDKARLDFENAKNALAIELGINNDFDLIPPDDFQEIEIDINIALNSALERRAQIIEDEIERTRAERDLNRARFDNSFNADLRASFGLNQTSGQIESVYQELLDQETFNLTFSIPIFQWGKSNSQIESALINRDDVDQRLEQKRKNFERDIIYQTKLFKYLQDQVKITKKSEEISERRFLVAKNRFLIGKIDLNGFFIAQNEKDSELRNYIFTLRDYWLAYYRLRELTLYDFKMKERIDFQNALMR